MRLLCFTSNECCTAADPADVQRQVEQQLTAAQCSHKDYPYAYRGEGYEVLHVGSGSFAKHDRRHHQSDHNYVWTVLDIDTPDDTVTTTANTPDTLMPKHHVDVYVACFQEMFVQSFIRSSQTKTAHTMHKALQAHGLVHRYVVKSTGIGQRSKKMGLGLYVWSRVPLTEQTALKATTLHRKTRNRTRRMLQQVLLGPHFMLTVGNVHLPMKANLRMNGKGVDPTNPMYQQKRNAILTKAFHSMHLHHAPKQGGTRRSLKRFRFRVGASRRRRSSTRYTLPASPESYVNVVQTRDMLSGTDHNVPYAYPHLPDGWRDIVYEWLTHTPSKAFCPTCEFVYNRPLQSVEGNGKRSEYPPGWSDVPDITTPVKRSAWKTEAAGSRYKLVKKRSYIVPSYCDRVLVRVSPGARGGRPHVQLLMGDMNYRVLPGACLDKATTSNTQESHMKPHCRIPEDTLQLVRRPGPPRTGSSRAEARSMRSGPQFVQTTLAGPHG